MHEWACANPRCEYRGCNVFDGHPFGGCVTHGKNPPRRRRPRIEAAYQSRDARLERRARAWLKRRPDQGAMPPRHRLSTGEDARVERSDYWAGEDRAQLGVKGGSRLLSLDELIARLQR